MCCGYHIRRHQIQLNQISICKIFLKHVSNFFHFTILCNFLLTFHINTKANALMLYVLLNHFPSVLKSVLIVSLFLPYTVANFKPPLL